MPREGRELEKLVATLERLLSAQDAEITSPDYIHGISSGIKREVDVALRGTIGSSDILVILECRDRKAKEDVTWIEQLAQKQQDVLAAKAVAVSSAGFSSSAVEYAKKLNIELRSVEEITLHDVRSWLGTSTVFLNVRRFEVIHVVLNPKKKASIKSEMLPRISADAPLFEDPIQNRILSLNQLWMQISHQHPALFEGIIPGEETILNNIAVQFAPHPVFFRNGEDLVELHSLILHMKILIEQSHIPPSSIRQYAKDSQSITQSVTFEMPVDGKIIKLDMHNVPSRGTMIMAKVLSFPSSDNETTQ